MTKDRKMTVIIAVVLICIAVLSFMVLSKTFSDPETLKGTVQALDEKEMTVAKMSALSIAAASAIDLIPGDAGQSISRQLVELGGFFIILFAAIYLEKILITVGGFVAFKVMIPIGLFLIAGFVMLRKDYLKTLGIKLITVGLVLFLIVPSSVWVSSMVDRTHDMSKQQAIEEIGEEVDLIEEGSGETTASESTETAEPEEELSLFERLKKSGSSVLGTIKESGSTVLSSAKEVPKKMNDLLDNIIEEVAYFFVSIIAIPLIVLAILVVFLKQILNFKGSGSGDYKALAKEMRRMMPGKHEAEE